MVQISKGNVSGSNQNTVGSGDQSACGNHAVPVVGKGPIVVSAQAPSTGDGTAARKPEAGAAVSCSRGAMKIEVDMLKTIVVGMVSGDFQIQQYIVEHYTAPDIRLVHFLGATTGRDDYLKVYRGATSALDYRVTFRDIIIGEDKAMVWLDLKVKPRLGLLSSRRIPVPCLVLLYFKPDPVTGQPKLYLQHDHHSLYLLSWVGGSTSWWLLDQLVRPVLGQALVMLGIMADQAKWLRDQLYQRLGWRPTTHTFGDVVDDSTLQHAIQQAGAEKVVPDPDLTTTGFLRVAWSVLVGIVGLSILVFVFIFMYFASFLAA